MASQPLHRYELIKLAERLNKDYYPLTELLCRNARVQAEWLQGNNSEVAGYVRLCTELSEHIARHLSVSRELISDYKDNKLPPVQCNAIFRQSREAITHTLTAIKEENAMKKIKEWQEMHENLRLQLMVLNNLLTELFRIEDTDLIPLLEHNLSIH
jgi:hypothetical protein